MDSSTRGRGFRKFRTNRVCTGQNKRLCAQIAETGRSPPTTPWVLSLHTHGPDKISIKQAFDRASHRTDFKLSKITTNTKIGRISIPKSSIYPYSYNLKIYLCFNNDTYWKYEVEYGRCSLEKCTLRKPSQYLRSMNFNSN